jgi:hypothetical protein
MPFLCFTVFALTTRARVSASFRFTDYAQAKSTVLGFAGSTRDVVGAGKAIKEAHESSTEDGKPADVNEWTLSPSLKALVLLGWIEDQRSKLVRVRRLRHCCPWRDDETTCEEGGQQRTWAKLWSCWSLP